MELRKSAFVALMAIAAGCAGKPGPASPTWSVTSSKISLTTGDFTVPAGESFTCFYTSLRVDQAYAIIGANATQGPGGHHILAYYVDTPQQPKRGPCTDTEMLDWHLIAGGAGEASGNAAQYLTDGLAIQIPAGKQIVLQSHYINPLGHSETVNDSVELEIGSPSQVVAFANAFTLPDLHFDVPAGQTYQHQLICHVPKDLDIALILGHMHQYGQHFTLEEQAPGDTTWSTLYDTDWVPAYTSHPPLTHYPVSSPLHLTSGTQLRETCTWNNTTSSDLLFPDEMCVTFTYYFPDTGDGEIDCID